MVPSKSLNTASGLAAVELDSLEENMNSLNPLLEWPKPVGTKPLGYHFSLQGPNSMQHDERTCLGVQQKTRNLEAPERHCFAMLWDDWVSAAGPKLTLYPAEVATDKLESESQLS